MTFDDIPHAYRRIIALFYGTSHQVAPVREFVAQIARLNVNTLHRISPEFVISVFEIDMPDGRDELTYITDIIRRYNALQTSVEDANRIAYDCNHYFSCRFDMVPSVTVQRAIVLIASA